MFGFIKNVYEIIKPRYTHLGRSSGGALNHRHHLHNMFIYTYGSSGTDSDVQDRCILKVSTLVGVVAVVCGGGGNTEKSKGALIIIIIIGIGLRRTRTAAAQITSVSDLRNYYYIFAFGIRGRRLKITRAGRLRRRPRTRTAAV